MATIKVYSDYNLPVNKTWFVVHKDDGRAYGYRTCRELVIYNIGEKLFEKGFKKEEILLTIGPVPDYYPYNIAEETVAFINSVEKYCGISPLSHIENTVIKQYPYDEKVTVCRRTYKGVTICPNKIWLRADITLYIILWLLRVSFTTTADLFGGTKICRKRFSNISPLHDDIHIEGSMLDKMICLMKNLERILDGVEDKNLFSYLVSAGRCSKISIKPTGLRAFLNHNGEDGKYRLQALNVAVSLFEEIYKNEL